MAPYDGIVLAGGRSERMGEDKALISLGGHTFLERAVAALDGARSIVVAGPVRPLTARVTWVQEDPPGSGPAAGLAVALAVTQSPVVVVLPVDLPGVDRDVVARLRASVRGDGAVLVDVQGNRQMPAGAYDARSLRRALRAAEPPAGVALRSVWDRLDVIEVEDARAIDCDTPAELDLIRSALVDRKGWDRDAG